MTFGLSFNDMLSQHFAICRQRWSLSLHACTPSQSSGGSRNIERGFKFWVATPTSGRVLNGHAPSLARFKINREGFSRDH